MCHDRSTCLKGPVPVTAAAACLAALTFAVPVAASADDTPDLLNDPFHIALGTYVVTSKPTIQLNGETSRGDKVDFDKVLGGGDSTRVRLDADWRFGDSQRHKLRAMAFNVNRDREKTIDQEIEWGGVIYPVDANLKAEFQFSIIELAYEYAFWRTDTYEIGGTIGLHYAGLESSLKATSTSTGETIDRSNKASVDVPLPVIGARGLWKLPHNFFVDAQAQFFALSIDQYDGSLQDYRLMVTWQPKTWVGIGLGYNGFRIDVDVDADKFDGSLDWQYDGPMIFYSVSF